MLNVLKQNLSSMNLTEFTSSSFADDIVTLLVDTIMFFSNIQHFCGYIKQLPSLDDKNNKLRKVVTRKHSRDGADEDM